MLIIIIFRLEFLIIKKDIVIYRVEGEEKGTIFCIHGNSSSSKVFESLFNSTELKQSIVVIDLPGHGTNQNIDDELPNFSFFSLKNYLLKAVSEVNDGVLLIGNSLGGHLAIEIATEIKNLKGLVIMGTPPLKKPINFQEAFIQVPELNTFFKEFPTDEEIEAITEIAMVNKKNKHIIIDDFKRSNPLVRSALAVDLSEDSFEDEYDVFTNLTIPKYIIAGDSDPSVNRSYLDQIKNECRINCELIEINDCGHYPSVDRPLEFNRIIEEICKNIFD